MTDTISIDVPEEPAHGSVILDSRGHAWQRTQPDYWTRAGSIDPATNHATWKHLIADHGTVTVLHRGDAR